ncbi:MAG: hypothetical protein ACFFDS_01040 [Candidatus Thorarchaeota archaeon]
MRKINIILILTLLTSAFLFIQPASSYIPSDILILDQQNLVEKVDEGTDLLIAISVKNYLNYTITNITISLNITEINHIYFNSCVFGYLADENVTSETTTQSSSEYGFTPTDITYGYMTKKYLEFNVSEIIHDKKFVFFYNLTSDEETRAILPRVHMTYYDNWTDFQEMDSRSGLEVLFESEGTEINPLLPDWRIGKEISNTWAWIIFAVAPIAFGIIASAVLYIRKR